MNSLVKKILRSKLTSIIIHGYQNDIPVETRWLGVSGFKNFCSDFEKDLKQALKNYKARNLVGHRGRSLVEFCRIQTGWGPGNGEYTRTNIFVRGAHIKLKKTTEVTADRLGINSSLQPAIPSNLSRTLKNISTRVPELKDIPWDARRIHIDGRSITFKQFCKKEGVPEHTMQDIMDENPNMLFEDAAIEAYHYHAQQKLTVDGKEMSLMDKANELASQYPGLTRDEIILVLQYQQDNTVDIEEVKNKLRGMTRGRTSIVKWDLDGSKEVFESRQKAAAELCVSVGSINKNLDTGKPTKGYYFTSTENAPTALRKAVRHNSLVMRLFKEIAPVMDFSLSDPEKQALVGMIGEAKTLEEIADILEITISQVEEVVEDGFKSLGKGALTMRYPNGIPDKVRKAAQEEMKFDADESYNIRFVDRSILDQNMKSSTNKLGKKNTSK